MKEHNIMMQSLDAFYLHSEGSNSLYWALEKYRTLELQKNKPWVAEYFKNIEACIETEFSSFDITCNSKSTDDWSVSIIPTIQSPP
ncbi:MAG: hypothetical protein LBB80_09850 [Treponema sp.]|jgi:hypothetical protein|nr:hypothetical protein [Treponema sp.]